MRFVAFLILLTQLVIVNSSALAQPAKTPRRDVHGDPIPDGAIARLGTLRFQVHCKPLPNGAIVRVGLSRFGAASLARDVALSPDGKTVAVAIAGNKRGTRVYYMDTATGKSMHRFDVSAYCDGSLQFAPNGKGLAFSGWPGINLVDGTTGKLTQLMNDDRDSAIALTKDGKWLAAQPREYTYHAPVCVWDAKTATIITSLPGRGASCKGLAFGQDRKRLLLWSVVPTRADATSIGFSSTSKVAIACIDINKRKILGDTTIGYYQNVALCPDGETVAVEDAQRQRVRLLHLPTGREHCVIPMKKAQLAFAPDGQMLVTIAEDGRAALWDTTTGTKIRNLEGALASEHVRIIGISRDGTIIAALDGGWHSAASVVVWNAATGKRVVRPPGHRGAVTCLSYRRDGKLLASGSMDKTVRLWNPVTGAHLRKLADHKKAITAVAISPDGKHLASASQDGVIQLSNMADGKVVAKFAGPKQGAKVLAFTAKDGMLLAGGDSSEVFGWQIAGAKKIARRFKTAKNGSVLAFADEGALALTSTWEYRFFGKKKLPPERLHLWNPKSKKAISSMPIRPDAPGHFGTVRCEAAAFSPDARLIASSQITEMQGIRPSYGFARLRLWERATGQEILTLGSTITKVLAFSSNGRLLATGRPGKSGHLRVGYGTGIDIWDIVAGKKVGGLPVTPNCLAFSPDGLHLATGGRDNCILIWKAPRIQTPNKAVAPSATTRDAWWKALGGPAKGAYQTMARMIETPEHTVAFLKKRVKPVQPSDPKMVAKLITQLDSKRYAVRIKAQAKLEKLGEGTAHLLKKALDKKVTLELHMRLKLLLRKYDAASATSILGMQQHRAVETLEWIGTPAARALLRTWADGAPHARLVIEAKAALRRLQD